MRSKREVLKEYKRFNKTFHGGRVLDICVETGSELPLGDPNRKYKGRVVFQGNDVKDENYDYALFAELGSSPATMQAGKFADAIGLLSFLATRCKFQMPRQPILKPSSKAPTHGSIFPRNNGQTGGTNCPMTIRSVLSSMPYTATSTLVAIGSSTAMSTLNRSASNLCLIPDGLHATGTRGYDVSSLSMWMIDRKSVV